MRNRTLILTALIFLLLSNGCATYQYKSSQTPRELAATEEPKEMAGMKTFPGADSSSLDMVALITPPQVLRVWIYDHVTPTGEMVVGHWVFIKIEDSKWFIEKSFGGPIGSDTSAARVPFTTSEPTADASGTPAK